MQPEQIINLLDKMPCSVERENSLYHPPITIVYDLIIKKIIYGYIVSYEYDEGNAYLIDFDDNTLAGALNKMLIWLAENGYVDFKGEV